MTTEPYRDKMLEEIAILFGGRAAEEVFLNSMSTGASNDFEQARRKMARDMVTRYGMSDVLGTMVYVDDEDTNGMFGKLASRRRFRKRRSRRSTRKSAACSTSSTASPASCWKKTATRSKR